MKATGAIVVMCLIFYQAAAQIGSKIKEQAPQGISGVWQNNEFGYAMTLWLGEDGTGEFDGEVISYTASGGNLMMRFATDAITYQYSLSGTQLMLSGGDLDSPITFKKGDNAAEQIAKPEPEVLDMATGESLLGRWENQGQVLDFRSENKVAIDGNTFDYQTHGSTLMLSTPQGAVQFQYQLSASHLTLTGTGGSIMYRKLEGNQPAASQAQAGSGEGSIPQELAGKWCYVNVASTNSGGWSTDECITLYENGTYEYFSENSGSATVTNQYGTQIATGGTASQNSDAGTWNIQGNMIVAKSRSGSTQSFNFEKRNHPKNGDPMIVLNGRTYVTYYQKAPWRKSVGIN